MKVNLKRIIVFVILMITIFNTISFGNSAQPPTLVILVNNPPENLKIEMLSKDQEIPLNFRKLGWEGQFSFFDFALNRSEIYKLRVTHGDVVFECTIDGPLKHYNEVFTLNLKEQTLTRGEYPLRSFLLVGLRLSLTLLIEGIIFWMYGFRQKSSWIIFLIINLITQGFLNIWLNSDASVMPSYFVFTLIFGELFIFITEMIAFPILIKEENSHNLVSYAFVANFASLVIGCYMISRLPV